jgi:hypothetical protein
MSKPMHSSNPHGAPDPSAGNVRDPQQKGDELSKHDTPRKEDPTQRNQRPAKPGAKD